MNKQIVDITVKNVTPLECILLIAIPVACGMLYATGVLLGLVCFDFTLAVAVFIGPLTTADMGMTLTVVTSNLVLGAILFLGGMIVVIELTSRYWIWTIYRIYQVQAEKIYIQKLNNLSTV